MLKKGLIQIYTGDCHRTNYAPMGLGLRAAGQHLRVYMTCFLPFALQGGAMTAANLLEPYLIINLPSFEKRPDKDIGLSSKQKRIVKAFNDAKQVVSSGHYDVVILHEIIPLIVQGAISIADVMEILDMKPNHVEVVLSGPGAPQDIVTRADLVTEMSYYHTPDPDLGEKSSRPSAPAEIITGNGKGKTTYCLGKAMLMSCTGTRVKILQFIKSPKPYGEIKAIEKLPYIDVKTMGKGCLLRDGQERDDAHLDTARRAWEECLREIFSLKYGLIVLDEINIATRYNLVHPERIREMLFLKPRNLHILLSGRNAHEEVKKGANAVIDMKEIKHPLKKGVKARKGIEF